MSETLITDLYKIGAVQFGEFKLKSGATSSIYINLRKIVSYPKLLSSISTAMWQQVKDLPFDLVCGVPYTALPIATCMSLSHDIPMVMRRKEKKDYGTKQMLEGVFEPGQRCLIIEDIITSGMSIIETANDIQEAELQVQDVIALIDREQGGRQNLEKKFRVHTLLKLSTILDTLLKADFVSAEEKTIIKAFIQSRVTT